jgi:hypothetical protein
MNLMHAYTCYINTSLTFLRRSSATANLFIQMLSESLPRSCLRAVC